MVRVEGAADIEQRNSKTSAIASVVFDLHAPSEECGQEEERGKSEHGGQNDGTGNRRAGNFTNFGDEKWRWQENQPHPNGTALHFFGMGIHPGEQVRHKENW